MSERWFTDAGRAELHDAMSAYVERGELPGLIALAARGDRAHVDVIGTKAFGDRQPMERDAIFRITSLTKPITAAATMTLIDGGTLRLDDAIDELLPELANRQVLRSVEAQLDDTVPARRSITVEDLLTFRLGLGMLAAPPGTYPIQVAETQLGIGAMGAPWPPPPHPTDEWLRRLGTLPLIHQPGEQWLYNAGSMILGALLERATGRSFETVLRERLLDPLGMSDTAFTITPAMTGRVTTAYASDPQTGALRLFDAAEGSYWNQHLPFPSGAGWLLSTIDDFWAFARMLVNGGVHEGQRILSESSVALMTTDHLTAAQRAAAKPFLGDGGWGYGMRVSVSGTEGTDLPRGFGWSGGSGTTWTTDPDTGLTGILFTQRAMTSSQPPEIFDDFWRCAYAALED